MKSSPLSSLSTLLNTAEINQPLLFVTLGLLATYALHQNPLRGDYAMACFISIALAVAYFAHFFMMLSIYGSLRFSCWANTWFIITIIIATVLYRVSPLHPLWEFPGPIINKITSLRMAQIVYSGKRHVVIPALHEEYGPFVRTGPNTLSINSYTAIAPIYASSTAFPKSQAYTPGRMHSDGLFFLQDIKKHNERRKLWANAFSSSAVLGWKPLIEKRTIELLCCMDVRSSHGTKGLDLSEALTHWSYDVMCDITYGGAAPLDIMAKGDVYNYIDQGKFSTILFQILGEVPSLFDILHYLPTTKAGRDMEKLAQNLIDTRKNGVNGRSDDIASWLLGEHDGVSANLSDDSLRIESLFAIQAGSDSTSGALTFAFYYLLSNKLALKRLVQELDEAFEHCDKSTLPLETLTSLPYLNAVVNESLRLGTPLPELPRVVPQEGAVISGKFIPGSTIVGINALAQMTSVENFYPDPELFRPERWLPGGLGPESRARKGAMISFSFGTFSCLGKGLVLQEMRLVLAHVLLKYNLEFAPEWDRTKFEDSIDNMRTSIFNYPLLITLTNRY